MAQPVVTLQPRDVTIDQDNSAHFSVRASGASSIVWQRQEPGGSTFADMVPNSSEWWAYGASNLQIFATGPANSGARYRAAIHGAGGTLVYSEPATLTIRARMQVTGISPAMGPVEGNTSVVLAGEGFTGASKVYFGSREAPSFTVDSDTQITAITPASAAGIVDVTVLAPQTSFQAQAGFTFGDPGSAPPVFTAFAPSHGPVAGGNTVVITGTGLSSVNGVTVDSRAVRYSIESDEQISIEMPPAPANPVRRVVEIQLNSPWGSLAHGDYYVYSGAELATLFASSGSLSPAFTPNVSEYWLGVGAEVSEITFTPGRAGNWLSASVNGQPPATPVALQTGSNAVAIEVSNTLDGSARTYTVTVLRPAVEPVVIASQPRLVRTDPSLPGSLTVIATGATGYTWQIHRPDEGGFRDVTWMDGSVEAGGSRLAISGSVTAGSQFRVKVRGQNAQEVISDVVVLDGPSAPPVIQGFSVGSVPTTGGTEVIVSGRALAGVTAVTVGGVPVGFTPIDDTSLSFMTPPAAAGTTEIVVTSPHGSARRAFHYGEVAPTPVITNISPASVPENGGTVVISGSNFTGTEVTYGGLNIEATIDSDSQITAVMPPGFVGEGTLYVSTPWDTSAGWPLPRHYQGTLLSGLAPSSGQLSPAFNSYASHYSVAVPDEVAQITLTPTALRYGPGITINGQAVASGQASQPIALSYGDNTIAVEVRSSSGAQTRQITLTVTRASAPAVIVSHPRSILDNGQALTLSVVAENAVEYIWGKDRSGFVPLDPGEATGLGTPTITLPSGAYQSYRVAVRGTDGNLVFSDSAKVSLPVAPRNLYALPDTGPAAGGNWVRIGELDFTGVTGIRFGGVP
ncbi:MAG TPA: IPT/TIG domain-containing protein, partial [Devosia sp.]|nr:IPT/TIG domain-containing protein [Devosia sp.]